MSIVYAATLKIMNLRLSLQIANDNSCDTTLNRTWKSALHSISSMYFNLLLTPKLKNKIINFSPP